eukprot:365419-Chlamydomonas_euryale.AAC.4
MLFSDLLDEELASFEPRLNLTWASLEPHFNTLAWLCRRHECIQCCFIPPPPRHNPPRPPGQSNSFEVRRAPIPTCARGCSTNRTYVNLCDLPNTRNGGHHTTKTHACVCVPAGRRPFAGQRARPVAVRLGSHTFTPRPDGVGGSRPSPRARRGAYCRGLWQQGANARVWAGRAARWGITVVWPSLAAGSRRARVWAGAAQRWADAVVWIWRLPCRDYTMRK